MGNKHTGYLNQPLLSTSKEHERLLEQEFCLPASMESHFTLEEQEILETYGTWLNALEKGDIEPKTEEQRRLLNALSGAAEPNDAVQKTWVKWATLRKKRIVCSLCKGSGELKHHRGDGAEIVERCRLCKGTGEMVVKADQGSFAR